jgi:small-conductance mechanosensitive channel/CRP-like cAMP-binding protein
MEWLKNELFGILWAVGYALMVLVPLTVVYKALSTYGTKKSPLISAIIDKIRFWLYLEVNLLALAMLFFKLPDFPGRIGYLDTVNKIIIVVLGILLIEGFLGTIFDYFLSQKKAAQVPRILKDVTKGLLYIVLAFIVLQSFFNINLKPLFTTSAVVSIIIGLALQEVLGNLFSGLILNLSRPYSIGDLIKAGNWQGMVEKIDWRATTLKNAQDNYVVIPNSILAKTEILNFSLPSLSQAREIFIGVHYRHPPREVMKILREASSQTDGVLPEPEPLSFLVEYGESAVKYKVRFWIEDSRRAASIESEIMEKLWYRFLRENIEIPFPIHNVYLHEKEEDEENLDEKTAMLRKIDFLKQLPEENLNFLAHRLKQQLYARGEVVFRQGDHGDSFYILRHGLMHLFIKNQESRIILDVNLNPGTFFGEMSLLTGQPRSATIEALEESELLMLNKEDFHYLLADNLDLQKLISHVIAERESINRRKMQEEATAAEAAKFDEEAENQRIESSSDSMFKMIRNFFSY